MQQTASIMAALAVKLLTSVLLYKIGEARRRNMFHSFTLLHVLYMVECSGYTFQRIDKNYDIGMAVGFTRDFHQCSIDSECNFVVKRKAGSKLEKMHKIEDASTFYTIWKKLEKNTVAKDESRIYALVYLGERLLGWKLLLTHIYVGMCGNISFLIIFIKSALLPVS